jgi:hypothetical protein
MESLTIPVRVFGIAEASPALLKTCPAFAFEQPQAFQTMQQWQLRQQEFFSFPSVFPFRL